VIPDASTIPDARTLSIRAARHAALGDPTRLRIADALQLTDQAPSELRRRLSINSNLLSHHLDVLEEVGLVSRVRSAGDGRRRYIRLKREAFPTRAHSTHLHRNQTALFICKHGSARSQLAAAIWRDAAHSAATAVGTEPGAHIHPKAVAAARRHGLTLGNHAPKAYASVRRFPPIVVTVCDEAHEALDTPATWLHWSLADPVRSRSDAAFDAVVRELRARIDAVIATFGARP
jgi:ArsR family transcriptional regulator, arsenate/arsenite/antimonite-responsive transcriptional repressor / arsenate reductase (thioredoxin)